MVNEEIVQDRAPDLNSYGRWARGIDIRAAADAGACGHGSGAERAVGAEAQRGAAEEGRAEVAGVGHPLG